MTSPQLIAIVPHSGLRIRRDRDDSTFAQISAWNPTDAMKTKAERPDADAELQQSFEPLRIGFAVLALLLGLIASLRF